MPYRRGIYITQDSLDNWKSAKCHTKRKHDPKRWKHGNDVTFSSSSNVDRYIVSTDWGRLVFMKPKEVLTKVNELGGNIKDVSNIRKYAELELIPKPERKGAGQGRGSISDYPENTPAEFRASQILKKGFIKLNNDAAREARKIATQVEEGIKPLEPDNNDTHVADGKVFNFAITQEAYNLCIGEGSLGEIFSKPNGECQFTPRKSAEMNIYMISAAQWLQNKLKGLAGFNPQDESVVCFIIQKDKQEEDDKLEYIASVYKLKV